MLLDLIDLSKLRRTIVYLLVLAGLFILQDLVVSQITILGVRAILIPAAVVAIGLFEGAPWGGLLGLAAGYFADMGYAQQLVLFTILFPAAGFASGVLGKYMLHKGFVSYIALMLVTLAAVTFFQMFRFLFFVSTDTWAVWRTGIIQLVWSLVWAVPIYFPCKIIASRPLGR